MITKLFKIFGVAFLLALPLQSCAQKQKSVKKMQQEHFDRQAEQDKAIQKAQDDGLKRHRDIQTKETQKRMKKTLKKSGRHREYQKEPFLKRLFRKKRR